jgi:hypothetical protein
MALERFLLEMSKSGELDIEDILIYILKNSKSASLTSVVNSIILYNPNKYFSVAKILFKTIELFDYDVKRTSTYETEVKEIYSIPLINPVLANERLETCKDYHRELSLEHLIVTYYFVHDKLTDEQFKKRKNLIEKIIDWHYNRLKENDFKKEKREDFRFILSRIDGRKMDIEIQNSDNNNPVIYLNPKLPPDLEKTSKNELDNINEKFKYLNLML